MCESDFWKNCRSSLLVQCGNVLLDSEMRPSTLAATNAIQRGLGGGYFRFRLVTKSLDKVLGVNVKTKIDHAFLF